MAHSSRIFALTLERIPPNMKRVLNLCGRVGEGVLKRILILKAAPVLCRAEALLLFIVAQCTHALCV